MKEPKSEAANHDGSPALASAHGWTSRDILWCWILLPATIALAFTLPKPMDVIQAALGAFLLGGKLMRRLVQRPKLSDPAHGTQRL